MGYEILGHTADIRLKVWGKDPEELFRDALLGMMQILKPAASKSDLKNKISKIKIKVSAADLTSLLIDFLNEALYQANVRKEIYNDARFKNLSENKLEAELIGVLVNEFDEDIKAVTYHEAEIKKRSDDQLETILIFDI